MEVLVSVVDDAGDETRSLRAWLAGEPVVRRYGQLTQRPVPGRSDAMGALEVLSIIAGSGLSLAQLLRLILDWRSTRPRPVLVRVQAGNRTVEVRTAGTADVPRLVEELEAGIGGAPEGR